MRGAKPEFWNRNFVAELFKHHFYRHPALDLVRLDAVKVRGEFASFFQFDDDYCVRNLGGEGRMINLMHDIEAENLTASGDWDPARLGRVTLRAYLVRGKSQHATSGALLHHQAALAGAVEKLGHVGRDCGNWFIA